ncbi:INO80 complex subunit D-like, partial [Photinus pyralis]
MLKGNQRCNGILPSITSSIDEHTETKEFKFLYLQNNESNEKIGSNSEFFSNKNALVTSHYDLQNSVSSTHVPNQNVEQKHSHSIIGLSKKIDNKINSLKSSSKHRLKHNASTYHESLQRIGGGDACYNHYQQQWFSSSLERLKLEDKSREERLEITRYELQRHLKQILRSNLGRWDLHVDNLSNRRTCSSHQVCHTNLGYNKLVSPRYCCVDKCCRQALPCSKYCTLHIMSNSDQVLFNYCTAKFADNTQCSVPVLDITHELPLCTEHARKRDNYRMFQETKPKKLRKKVKPSAMIRSQKRNKKKKRPLKTIDGVHFKCKLEPVSNSVVSEERTEIASGDIVEHALSLQESDGLELVSVEQVLVNQASNLLEESEINNVLSTIQADEFNDFFAVDRNGEYDEPTREETEELERALAAVDNDVKSLEKLTQSRGLLDSFLEEDTLVESLVQIPDVFHNGYSSCGDNIITQTSRFLSVE